MEQAARSRGRNNYALWPWLLATDRLLSNIQRFIVETGTAKTANGAVLLLLHCYPSPLISPFFSSSSPLAGCSIRGALHGGEDNLDARLAPKTFCCYSVSSYDSVIYEILPG